MTTPGEEIASTDERWPTSAPLDQEPWAGLAAAGHHRPFWRSRWVAHVLLLAAVVVVGLLAVAVVLRSDDIDRHRSEQHARTAAADAARAAAPRLLSYDYRTVRGLVDRNKALLTTRYEPSYAKTIDVAITPAAIRTKATLTAEVRQVAMRAATRDRATVLVFADLSSTNSEHPGARSTEASVTLTMEHDQGRWLVDDVTTGAAVSS